MYKLHKHIVTKLYSEQNLVFVHVITVAPNHFTSVIVYHCHFKSTCFNVILQQIRSPRRGHQLNAINDIWQKFSYSLHDFHICFFLWV